MKRLLLFVLITANTFQLYAQNRVCLPRLADDNGFGFPAGEVDSFLQLQQYKIILFGEQHNDRIDPEIKYHLITHLHKTYGYRHVFIEAGYSAAWVFNQFITKGDTILYQPTGAYRQFLKRLYAYNRSLPDNQKIIFHGVDFERVGVFKVVNALKPKDKPVPPLLQPVMDTVQVHLVDTPLVMYSYINSKMTLNDNAAFEKTLRWMQAQFRSHTADAKTYFGNNYHALEGIVNNASPVEVRPKRRNKTMFQNMKHTVEEEKIDKFIGFFGGVHTDETIASSLTKKIKGLPGFSGKDILTIREALYNKRDDSSYLLVAERVEILKSLNGTCKATFLRAADVPGFKKKADFVLVGDYE